MISFNLKDNNIGSIVASSGVTKFITKYNYRVYGLAITKYNYGVYGLEMKNNPLIWVKSCFYYRNIFSKQLYDLRDFFNFNKLNFILSPAKDTEIKHHFWIGLRHDVRNNINLSSSILKTIIYCLEDKMELKKDFKIGKLPVFK